MSKEDKESLGRMFELKNSPSPDGTIGYRSKASVRVNLDKEIITLLDLEYSFLEIIDIADLLRKYLKNK